MINYCPWCGGLIEPEAEIAKGIANKAGETEGEGK
jgi:hypothetical protein